MRPYVAELLATYDRTLNQIIADSTIAEDPDDPVIQEHLGAWNLSDAQVDELLTNWQERGEQGYSTEPFSEDHPATVTRLEGEIITVSEDEVSFTYCSVTSHRVRDAAGDVVEEIPRLDQPGEGTAVRVDGTWVLDRLDLNTSVIGCEDSDDDEGEAE